jgi:hypothetical protein
LPIVLSSLIHQWKHREIGNEKGNFSFTFSWFCPAFPIQCRSVQFMNEYFLLILFIWLVSPITMWRLFFMVYST